METNRNGAIYSDEQISIWSVRRRLFISYFLTFSLLFAFISGISAWLSYVPANDVRHAAELAMNAMGLASGRILWLAAFSIITVEVGNVIVEYLIVDRYKRGKEEANKKWQAWYERMQDAQRNGRPFEEPPPGTVDTRK